MLLSREDEIQPELWQSNSAWCSSILHITRIHSKHNHHISRLTNNGLRFNSSPYRTNLPNTAQKSLCFTSKKGIRQRILATYLVISHIIYKKWPKSGVFSSNNHQYLLMSFPAWMRSWMHTNPAGPTPHSTRAAPWQLSTLSFTSSTKGPSWAPSLFQLNNHPIGPNLFSLLWLKFIFLAIGQEQIPKPSLPSVHWSHVEVLISVGCSNNNISRITHLWFTYRTTAWVHSNARIKITDTGWRWNHIALKPQ